MAIQFLSFQLHSHCSGGKYIADHTVSSFFRLTGVIIARWVWIGKDIPGNGFYLEEKLFRNCGIIRVFFCPRPSRLRRAAFPLGGRFFQAGDEGLAVGFEPLFGLLVIWQDFFHF